MTDDFSREPARATRFDWLAFSILIAVAGAALFMTAAAHAEPYEIVMAWKKPTDKGHQTLGSPYESKEECRNAITRVKIMVSGARLQCVVATRSAADGFATAPIASLNGGFEQ
jgi:hypothetical protein